MKLEVGKRYNRRDGRIEKCTIIDLHGGYPAEVGGLHYEMNGRVATNDLGEHQYDLISEYIEPATEQPEYGPWHGWNGGECPVDGADTIQAICCTAMGPLTLGGFIEKEAWENIIAYRIKNTPKPVDILGYVWTSPSGGLGLCDSSDGRPENGDRKFKLTVTGDNIKAEWVK